MKKYIRKSLFALMFSATVFTYISCNEDTVTPTTSSDNLDFSAITSNDSTDFSNVLELFNVKILMKDIKLNVSGGNDSTNFKVGPYVIELNLNSPINIITAAFIPPGIYDRVKFEIHKPDGNEVPPDPEFVDPNGRYSVIIKGKFNGNDFIYKSKKSAHQILSFPNSLHVLSTGKSNITLMVRPFIWFIKNGIYLDPSDPANVNDIDNNIKDNINNNFKIFIDNDKNGIPDA